MNTKEYISSGIIESYILGIATKDEAAILECVMKNNAEVKAAYLEAQKTLEDFATVQAITPPEDLKGKIWSKIQQQANTPTTEPEGNVAPTKPIAKERILVKESNSSWKNWAVAASVLFLISIAGNVFWWEHKEQQQNQINGLTTQLAEQNNALQQVQKKWEVVTNPNIQTITLNGVEQHPDAKALVFWDKETKNVYLHAVNLPEPPEGMQYQLWAIHNGTPISAGMYHPSEDTQVVLSTIGAAQNFAITLEKAGGVAAPTLQNMYVIGAV
ncbi:anti-sigma factor [Paenimyroides aestuarii]|uniref:Anti-sigma factor n=1 Tax=Paenimyroides aestuarii TaxID=2968490 RepID=A0ABY5NTI4_9FLAO|nr:anti-sigma factor [Paenimyroides aestuarii]UUV21782.1 anti-sigma factor [Paenimyroides aestuarii]